MVCRGASELIFRRYQEVHGAAPDLSHDHFLDWGSPSGVQAALGYSRACKRRLFLEAYVDLPIEQELARALGRPFSRRDIIEIGNLAADNAWSMVRLWAETANDLGTDVEIAVSVLTRPLRAMFRRLGVTLYELSPAHAERLPDKGVRWGAYYTKDPVVCAGFIAEGQARLAAVVDRRDRKCA